LPAQQALRYEEPGFLDTLTSKITLPLAILAVTTVLLISLAVFIGLRLRSRGAPRRALQQELTHAQSPEGVAAVIRTAITQAHPILSSNFSREELRRMEHNKHLLYQIEALLDALDSSLFGGKTSPIEELKTQARQILKAL
jgi:hypothetical protein